MFKRNLTILYGSQTGAAQDLAEDIWRESKQYRCIGCVKPMDSYNVDKLIYEEIVVFVCSTTGQGEEPDNMKLFWKFLLRKSLPANSLCGVKFGVLGLGDSSYNKFNFVAKRLHKRLLQLGAVPLLLVGLCDDQHDLGAVAVSRPWITNLWRTLDFINPIPSINTVNPNEMRIYKWNVEIDLKSKLNLNFNDQLVFDDTSLQVTVSNNTRITTKNHFQDVRLITFKTEDSVKWNPGDVFVCRPENSTIQIDFFFQLMAENNIDLNRRSIISIKQFDDEIPLPQYLSKPISLETLVAKFWDLNAPPRARVFKLLSLNCKNELEKEKLMELADPEFQENLYNYVNRPRRTILEVLSDFPNATSTVTIQLLFEIFQTIRPRSYSIASSPQYNKLELLVAVVEYQTIISAPRLGICTNWLKNLKKDTIVNGHIRSGTFKVPENEETPIIMIGPGTGLAPFRSILQNREIENKPMTNIILFFGCRNYENDYHCRNDLQRFESNGMKLFCAFSRDQNNKVYVQHLIKKEQALIKDIIKNRNGFILLAGSSKNMPNSVKETLNEIFSNDNFINEMIKQNKYQEEVWA